LEHLSGGLPVAQLIADPTPKDVADFLYERGWYSGPNNRWVLNEHVFTWEQALLYSMWKRFYLQEIK
jgi:hypothetical protein